MRIFLLFLIISLLVAVLFVQDSPQNAAAINDSASETVITATYMTDSIQEPELTDMNTYLGSIDYGGYTFTFSNACAAYIPKLDKYVSCIGKTDKSGNIWILNNLTWSDTESICRHEICHNLLRIQDYDEEESRCQGMLEDDDYEICSSLVDRLKIISSNIEILFNPIS
jgi:hypothetical protein